MSGMTRHLMVAGVGCHGEVVGSDGVGCWETRGIVCIMVWLRLCLARTNSSSRRNRSDRF